MNIPGEILSRSAKGLKTGITTFATRIGEKLGVVQREVQECAGKSAQEIAEMTSKKDVAQLSTRQVSKKTSLAERFRNFRTKLADIFTNKIPIKDKSSIEVDYRYSDNIRKRVSGIYEHRFSKRDYYTQHYNIETESGFGINWSLSKNPIKRFLGINNIDSVHYINSDIRTEYIKHGRGYMKHYGSKSLYVSSLPKEIRYYARPLP